MAVTSIVSYKVKPGRDEEFVQAVKEAKPVLESLGVNLKSIRLRRAAIAGANTGLYRLGFEYDDLRSWAATLEREAQDDRYNDILKRTLSEESPATIIGRVITTDLVPIAYASGNQAEGSVVHAITGNIKPGRMDDYIERTNSINQYVLRSGALNIKHTMGSVAGEMTGKIVTVSQYADLGAFAKAWKRNDEPEWRALGNSVAGPDGPIIVEFQSILTNIPL